MIDLVFVPISYGLMYVVIGAWRAIPLVAVVLLIDLLLRRKIAARFHCLLWSLVIFRLLCPVSIPSELSVQGHFDRFGESMIDQVSGWSDDPESKFTPPPLKFETFTFEGEDGQAVTLPIIPADATDEFRAEAHAYLARLNAERETDQYDAFVSPSAADVPAEYQQVSEAPVGEPQFGIVAWDWETIVAISILTVWFAVASGLILRSVAAHVSFSRRLRKINAYADANLQSQLDNACVRFGVRRVPAVKEVDGLSIPAVFGLCHPTICLPPGTAETLSAAQLDWVLSHELSHIKRRDAWLMTIATLARAVHWFNPLMHLAYSRLRLYVEQAADDLVTRRQSDRSPSEYGHVLLRYAAQSDRMPATTVGLLFVSSNKSLRHRLEMLDRNAKRNRLPAQIVAVAAIAVVGATGLTDAKPPVFHRPEQDAAWHPQQAVEPLDLPEPLVAQGPLIEETYDVKAVLKKLAEEDPNGDAELSLKSLFLIPSPEQPRPNPAPKIENGLLTISQTAESHRMTKLLLRSLERSGLNRQITLSIRVLDADPSIASAIDWTRRSIMAVRKVDNETNRLDEFVKSLDPDAKEDFSLQSNDASYRSRPMFAVKVSQQQLSLLMQRANQQPTSNMLMAPKVTGFSGQVMSITDQTMQPFLTGIKTIGDEDSVRDEPIIETVESGWRFTVYMEAGEGDRVDIHSVLTESELKSVEQADLPFLKPNQDVIVQVPHVAKTSASSSAKLAKGESLVILSPQTYDPNDKPESPRARFYILTPHVITEKPTPSDDAPPPTVRADEHRWAQWYLLVNR